MTEGKCAIWGTEVKKEPTTDSFEIYDSCRAGGKYKIPDGVKAVLDKKYNASNAFKAKLTTWLVNQRLSGNSCPTVSSPALEAVNVLKFSLTSERVDRFFKYISSMGYRIGGRFLEVEYHPEEDLAGERAKWFCDEFEAGHFSAHTECVDKYDLFSLLDYLIEEGLVRSETDPYVFYTTHHILTSKGISRLEMVETQTNAKQAFVAMWFDPSLNDSYENAIEPAIREAGYEPQIIRKVEHNNKIDDEIIAEIRRSKFVIADFTCGFSKEGSEAIARGGVYYEAGFAQGLGLPVIWTCREDIISHVHFDTRQYNHIVWKDAADLKEKLLNRIRATIT